jgi:hypothetical protein
MASTSGYCLSSRAIPGSKDTGPEHARIASKPDPVVCDDLHSKPHPERTPLIWRWRVARKTHST